MSASEKISKTSATPKSIRNLTFIAPEGYVGVWADKKKVGTYFVAVTTKSAGWGAFTQRSHLEGPMDESAMLLRLTSLKKRGAAALEHVVDVLNKQMLAVIDNAVDLDVPAVGDAFPVVGDNDTTADDADDADDANITMAITSDPLYFTMLERAAIRTVERNQQLLAEVGRELGELTIRYEELIADNPESEEMIAKIHKLEFNIYRKKVMVAALQETLSLAA